MGIIESGSLRTLRTSIRGPRGGADGLINQLVAGENYATGRLGPSPMQYLPDSEATLRRTMMYHWLSGAQMVSEGGTTDGTSSMIFETLTNSGTFTAVSTTAGYEGQARSVTGATSGNQNAFIATPGFLDVATQLAVAYTSLRLPDPNVAAYDLYFGYGNKQADPAGTAFTDGAWWSAVTAAGALPFKPNTTTNSSATQSATQFTQASGTAQSVELAVVVHGQVSADFWWRLPGTASNLWNKFNQAPTTMPRNSIVMRPHLVVYTRSAATITVSIQDFSFWWLRPTTW